MTVVADASAGHALDDITGGDMHRVTSNVAGLYGNVLATKNLDQDLDQEHLASE